MNDEHPARELGDAIAELLAHPDGLPARLTSRPWWRQSLAHGAPGIALLHIERAAAGLSPWRRAHDWLAYATQAPLTTGFDSHLFYGAPAVAHALACAADLLPGSYTGALDHLDRVIAADVRRRASSALGWLEAGHLPSLSEFDLVRGLTGIGSYLLRRAPGSEATRAVLEYLVRLTEPTRDGEESLPGWWTLSGPDGHEHDHFKGGHANSGLAHGIGGPLALLALASRRDVVVDRHLDAISRICTWLDRWRTDTPSGPIWPYWVNRPQQRADQRSVSGSQRPSWCYGTAGLARAQQLAALATGDTERRDMAERALMQALTDPAQRSSTTDPTLCHGYAGLAHIAARVAADAAPDTAEGLHALIPDLLDSIHTVSTDPGRTAVALLGDRGCGPAFLEGGAGIALAVLTPTGTGIPRSGWDTCLLVA
ncbi:lanthionine synthetase C family protein [Actinomadura sp. WMMB 499]|uniref:lanthionine synthetase C family protein n=1 Tax=Actinomadura sp. WMMB 499 TaxID=1219491 RepID=UPI001244E8D5|nr:lanthionine synthetase C family protein [Actinomadura sp. WMMB 499]QFG22881.1 lanthionine synthetase C family protein [Actinomadura sp. WMMB 499]